MVIIRAIGIILLVFLILLLGLLCCKVRLELRGKNGEVFLRIGIGKLFFQIWPMPKFKVEKKPDEPPEIKKEKPKRTFYPEQLSFGEALDLMFDLLNAFRDKLRIETLLFRVIFATGNAARTGLLLGGTSAMAGIMTPFFVENFHIDNYQVMLDADFDSEKTKWSAVFVCAVRPGSVLIIFWKVRKRILGILKKLWKKEEAKQL